MIYLVTCVSDFCSESNVTQTGKDEKDIDNSPSFYAEGIDNLMLYHQKLPPILYGKSKITYPRIPCHSY